MSSPAVSSSGSFPHFEGGSFERWPSGYGREPESPAFARTQLADTVMSEAQADKERVSKESATPAPNTLRIETSAKVSRVAGIHSEKDVRIQELEAEVRKLQSEKQILAEKLAQYQSDMRQLGIIFDKAVFKKGVPLDG